MSVVTSSNTVLHQGTITKLFSLVDSVDKSEKEELIKDWLVRYGSNNPIIEETNDENVYTVMLLVRNNTTNHWKTLHLVGDSFGWDTPTEEFTKIPDTRWWFIKFERPRGARLHYLISPNDPASRITDETRAARWSNFMVDERNQTCFNEGILRHSIIELPGFVNTVQAISTPHDFTNIYLRQKIDGNRSARFCVIGKSPKKLMVIHDGSAFSKIMGGQDIITKGVEEGRWPSMALLCLNTPVSERTREYGGRYGYPKFFKEVILPAIQQHIGIQFGPEDIILHGSSLGAWGLLDVVAQTHVADNLIMHSCPFWWPDDDHQKYIREMRDHQNFGIKRLYFDVGIYETGRVPMSTYESNQHFARSLETIDGIDFMAREFLMGHRYSAWAWALSGALDFIFNGEKDYGPLPGRPLNY